MRAASAAIPATAPAFGADARYAVYYAPPADSAWWHTGCAWLQRDPATAASLAAPAVPGLSRPLAQLTAAPRGYGWHGTLVAPFRCGPGIAAQTVYERVCAWAQQQQRFLLPARVAPLGRFVAIQAAASTAAEQAALAAMSALAASAVQACAPLRAAPSAAELAKRRTLSLSPRQEALLQAWGYPFVFEEFRFHMTLSDPLEAADAEAMLRWWAARLEALGPLPVAAVALYVQPEPAADFLLWQRVPLGGAAWEPA